MKHKSYLKKQGIVNVKEERSQIPMSTKPENGNNNS